MTWCKILDNTSELHTTRIGKTYDWNSYADRDGATSIPNYVESNAASLRRRLISYLMDIGTISFEGRTITEHMKIDEGFSLWSMSLPVEKSLMKSPQLFTCLRLVALHELLTSAIPTGVELVSANEVLAGAIEIMCRDLGITFRWTRSAAPPGSSKNLLRRVYSSIPKTMQAAEYLARHTFTRWSLRRARSGSCTEFRGDVTAFSYFIHLNKEPCRQGHFSSRHWGPVADLLNSHSRGTNWFHHYLESQEMPDKRTALAWLSKFNGDPQKQGCHLFLDSFLNASTIWRIVRSASRFSVLAWQLRNIGDNVPTDKFPAYLWPFLRGDFFDSICGRTAIQNLLWFELFDVALAALPKQSLGLYLNENQGWERVMIHSWRKYGHGKLIAVAHATIPFWDLRYIEDPRVFTEKTQLQLCLPDKLAVNGASARNAMIAAGYPEGRLVEVEAQRYLGLASPAIRKYNDPARHSVRVTGDSAHEQKRLLVLGDCMRAITSSMMNLLQRNATEFESRFSITLKPHPGCPVTEDDYKPLKYNVTQEPLDRIAGKYDVAYASNATSAAFDVSIGGLSVVIHLSPGEANLSPMRGIDGAIFVSTPEELMNSLEIASGKAPTNVLSDLFWLDPDLPRWHALISQSSATASSTESSLQAKPEG